MPVNSWFAMPGRPRRSAYLDLQADEEDAIGAIVGAPLAIGWPSARGNAGTVCLFRVVQGDPTDITDRRDGELRLK